MRIILLALIILSSCSGLSGVFEANCYIVDRFTDVVKGKAFSGYRVICKEV